MVTDLQRMIHNSHEYRAISIFYGDRCANRSGVPLMNHINEGLTILSALATDLMADLLVMKAWCLHPLLQNDDDLVSTADRMKKEFIFGLTNFSAPSIVYAMEYRAVANAYLAAVPFPATGIKLGPLPQTRLLLIADKVQNRKDFEIYHKGKHPNSDRLTTYFNEWCEALAINEPSYQHLISLLPGKMK